MHEHRVCVVSTIYFVLLFSQKQSLIKYINKIIKCVYLCICYFVHVGGNEAMIQVMFMSWSSKCDDKWLARVAGGAAVEAGGHAAGAADRGGVDAAHGAGDGEAGADVAQGLTRDPRARGHNTGLGADVEVSTGGPAQSTTDLERERTSVRLVTVKDFKIGSLNCPLYLQLILLYKISCISSV